jgi:hypothetical protein
MVESTEGNTDDEPLVAQLREHAGLVWVSLARAGRVEQIAVDAGYIDHGGTIAGLQRDMLTNAHVARGGCGQEKQQRDAIGWGSDGDRGTSHYTRHAHTAEGEKTDEQNDCHRPQEDDERRLEKER